MKPSPKRENESALEYVERLDWEKSRIDKDALNRPIEGMVATSQGFKHWSDSWRVGTPTGGNLNRKHVQTFSTDIFGEVEPIKKTTPTEKVQRLVQMLLDDAITKYKLTGRIEFSRSVLRRLSDLTGLTEQQLEMKTLEDLRGVYAQYAARLLVEAENKSA